jgi:hypothetical protein
MEKSYKMQQNMNASLKRFSTHCASSYGGDASLQTLFVSIEKFVWLEAGHRCLRQLPWSLLEFVTE